MILKIISSGPFSNNVIVAGCDKIKKVIIFDPTFGSKPLIDEFISQNNLMPIGIYLTHSHFDHIANCNMVQQEYNIPLYVHELDSENVKNPGSDKLPLLFLPVESSKIAGYLENGDKIEVGEICFEVIHTPGHSPGGVSFYEKKHKILISGDTLFRSTMGNLALPTANENDMKNSLKKLSKLPPDTKVIPGHGETTTIGEEKWLNNLDQIFS